MRLKGIISSEIVESYAGEHDNILDLNPGWDEFEKNYSPLTKIKSHLIKLSGEYNLGEVSFKPKNNNDWNSIDSFHIKSPENWDYDKISHVWDEIIDNTMDYAEKEGILPSLNSLTIVVD